MAIIQDLELPIEKTTINGPAVRGLEARKEDNNNERASVAKFRGSYEGVKAEILKGLRNLGAISYK
jgi:hypothetical protein